MHTLEKQVSTHKDASLKAESSISHKKPGRPSRTGLKRLVHCVYDINYHIVFTTKYRRKVINEEILQLIIEISTEIAAKWGCEVLEMNGEADHVHILLSAPPNFNLSNLIGNIKTITSRTVRKRFARHVKQYYWKPYFWNPSYCVLSTGGAPIEIIRKYIESQAGAPNPALAKPRTGDAALA